LKPRKKGEKGQKTETLSKKRLNAERFPRRGTKQGAQGETKENMVFEMREDPGGLKNPDKLGGFGTLLTGK